MFRSKLTACLLVGVLATAAVGAPLAATSAANFFQGPRLAQCPLGRLIMGNVGRLMVLRSELNITDAQREQIVTTLKAHKPEIAREAEKVWQKRTALRDAVLADTPDEQAIRKAADDLGDAIGDAAVLAAKIRGEVAPVLTDDQKEQIRKCRTECGDAVERFFAEATKAE